MPTCALCGAADAACGGPTTSAPIDGEETVVVSMPRKGLTSSEAPDMVRVQLKPNDIRSYRRRDANDVLKANPGAFIVGEGPDDGADTTAPEPDRSTARGRRAAPNKGRQTAPTKETPPPASTEPPTKETPPDQSGSTKPAETKSE